MKPKLLLSLALILSGGLLGCSTSHPSGLPVAYHNSQYDLTFCLPADWRGYSVRTQQWNGETYVPAKDEDEVLAHGPVIEILRSPQWKAGKPYQDIPIMVFTHSQWDGLHHGNFFPYAGGMIYEMWHNDHYVFGIYSRFNANDTVQGWDVAQKIVDRNCAAHPMSHLYSE